MREDKRVSTFEKLNADKQKQDEQSKAQIDLVKKACRSVFSTEYGIIVARAMMKVSGMYALDKNMLNPYEIGAERGKEYMYKFFIKGMLTDDMIAKIETSKGGD